MSEITALCSIIGTSTCTSSGQNQSTSLVMIGHIFGRKRSSIFILYTTSMIIKYETKTRVIIMEWTYGSNPKYLFYNNDN